ncbi:MAG: uroporphyrinogen decarboxylase [Candidatus Schekmanbacteria bacterium]|nr:uroporphyrinogen decarboxylase [Candidatus Schekmanbacteria bacterium]
MTSSISKTERFLRACRRQPVDRAPVWMMRQAGRYLAEYQAIRSRVSFIELCKSPDLAVEVSLQPLQLVGVEAVIMFSDILIPLEAMGAPIAFDDGGPRITEPLCSRGQVEALVVPDPEERMPFCFETIRRLRAELGGEVPLIGFAGAPYTLASYLVEGGSSKSYATIKAMLFSAPELAHALLAKLADTIAAYLQAAVAAGAQVVQLFDTWAGELAPEDYREFAFPYQQRVFAQLDQARAPAVLYVNGSCGILEMMAETGASVLSIDWRTDLAEARRRVGQRVALQGNVDPAVLLGTPEKIRAVTDETLRKGGSSGHILNLGHGILPSTPLANARLFCAAPTIFSEAQP